MYITYACSRSTYSSSRVTLLPCPLPFFTAITNTPFRTHAHTPLPFHPQEVALIGLLAYGAYIAAEVLRLSGILTLFVCGLAVSHLALPAATPAGRAATQTAFQALSYVAEVRPVLYWTVADQLRSGSAVVHDVADPLSSGRKSSMTGPARRVYIPWTMPVLPACRASSSSSLAWMLWTQSDGRCADGLSKVVSTMMPHRYGCRLHKWPGLHRQWRCWYQSWLLLAAQQIISIESGLCKSTGQGRGPWSPAVGGCLHVQHSDEKGAHSLQGTALVRPEHYDQQMQDVPVLTLNLADQDHAFCLCVTLFHGLDVATLPAGRAWWRGALVGAGAAAGAAGVTCYDRGATVAAAQCVCGRATEAS